MSRDRGVTLARRFGYIIRMRTKYGDVGFGSAADLPSQCGAAPVCSVFVAAQGPKGGVTPAQERALVRARQSATAVLMGEAGGGARSRHAPVSGGLGGPDGRGRADRESAPIRTTAAPGGCGLTQAGRKALARTKTNVAGIECPPDRRVFRSRNRHRCALAGQPADEIPQKEDDA